MKTLGLVLSAAFCLSMLAGCSGYTVQSNGDAEGKVFVSKGTSVWHCTAAGGAPKCKAVLD